MSQMILEIQLHIIKHLVSYQMKKSPLLEELEPLEAQNS